MASIASPSPPSLLGAVLRIAWNRYLQLLSTDPLLTKSVTSGTLSAVAAVLSARLGNTPLKSSAWLNEMTVGLVLRGPFVHAFHNFLDRVLFANVSNQNSVLVVLGKLAIDQLLFAPAFTSAYLYLQGMLRDVPIHVTSRKLEKELPAILCSNWLVWVPANLFGYACVPLELRVAWGSIVGVAWTTFLIAKVRHEEET